MFEIAIDTGGTFTDAVMVDAERRKTIAKTPTNVVEPALGIMGCVTELAKQLKVSEKQLLGQTSTFIIGTTLPTNAVTERKGARCCLIYTKGFRDVLELSRRIPKEDTFNLRVEPPECLIPRYLRYPVEERLQYDGKELTPVNIDDVRAAVAKAKEQGVEVPVVCFLHSYINSDHEEKAAEIIRKDYPNVVLSSHCLKTRLEGYRFHTAVLAAYVKPVFDRFASTLKKRLADNGFKGTLLFITGAGGLATQEVCLDNPALMIGSGPAAGPLFTKLIGDLNNFNNVMSIDIGGTTVDLSILPERRITTTTEMIIADHHKGLDSVDATSIGVGGGAIARLDERGMLRVGPQSAGASPGPACYDKGGTKPTLTDADIILGYIPTDYFLGGTIPLDLKLAKKAIQKDVAKPLGLDITQAAYSVACLAEENVGKEIFLSFVKKGYDPREFVFIAGGGAGPTHAAQIARGLEMKTVYVPKLASVFCPFGILLADYKYILTRFSFKSGKDLTVKNLQGYYDSMEKEGIEIMRRQGIAKKDMRLVIGADIRYYGQLHDIEVLLPEAPVGEPFTEEIIKALVEGFHERHRIIYGRANTALPVTFETVKVHAIGKRRPIEMDKLPLGKKSAAAALKRKRPVFFKECGFTDTPCYDGNLLQPGNEFAGPAIIEEPNTTIVVPPDFKASVDVYRNYVLRS